MTSKEALEIIKKEKLFHYNWFETYPVQPNEVVIKKSGVWFVFRTDADDLVSHIEDLTFESKSEALEEFIKLLKETKSEIVLSDENAKEKEQQLDEIIEKELGNNYLNYYVGEVYFSYYKKNWAGHEGQKIFPSWNWPAILFCFPWFLYRKMFTSAIIIYSIFWIVEGLCDFFINTEILTGSIIKFTILLFIYLIIAIIANSLYRDKAVKIVKKAAKEYPDTIDEYLEKKGGTSAFIAAAGTALLLSVKYFAPTLNQIISYM